MSWATSPGTRIQVEAFPPGLLDAKCLEVIRVYFAVSCLLGRYRLVSWLECAEKRGTVVVIVTLMVKLAYV